MNRDSQTRMTNDEIRTNTETRMTNPATVHQSALRHSSFGFLSSLVICHSSFDNRQTALSFQDRRISESLNSRQAICLRRRDADFNNAEMHGPKSASRSSLMSPTLLAVCRPAFIDLLSCNCSAFSMRLQATTPRRFGD